MHAVNSMIFTCKSADSTQMGLIDEVRVLLEFIKFDRYIWVVVDDSIPLNENSAGSSIVGWRSTV
jgi:hypothetical protein